MLRRLVCALLLTFFASSLVALPDVAIAQDADQAQNFYQEGMDSYFAGKYSEAIISFKKAYELDPNPIFLFNMSIAYEKAGNPEEAYEQGRIAQDSGTLPEQASQINQARLPALSAILKSQEVAGRVSGELECESDSDCAGGLTCQLSSGMCVEPGTEDGPPNVASSGPFLGVPFSTYGWVGSGLAVIGVGLAATSLVINLGLGSDIDAYNDLPDSEKRLTAGQALSDDIESRQQTGQILLYSGAGLAAVGAGLIVFDLFFNAGNEHVRVDFAFGSDHAYGSLQFDF